jgi:hypothetical protein
LVQRKPGGRGFTEARFPLNQHKFPVVSYSAVVFTISGETHIARPDAGRTTLPSVVAVVDGKFVVGSEAHTYAGEHASDRLG